MTVQLGSVSVNEGKILKVWFDLEQFRSDTVITPQSSSSTTDQDKQVTRTVTSTAGEQVTLSPIVLYNTSGEVVSYSYSSDNPSRIGVDSLGNVVFLVSPEQTTTANITVTATVGSTQVSKVLSVTLTVSGSVTIDVINGGVTGSARKALTDVIDTALSGADVNTDQAVYSSQDHVNGTYIRNSSFFLQSTHADALTCASPWNSRQSNKRAGTAVTPQHILFAAHYSFQAGDTIRFVTSDNTVITRTIVQIGNVLKGEASVDAGMALLDSALPSSITPCKIFPSNFSSYLPASAITGSVSAYRLPLLVLDQEEKGIVMDILRIPEQITTVGQAVTGDSYTAFSIPELSDRVSFYENIISGDSGNPIFAVIGNELWLVSTFFGSTAGPAYNALVTELNAMINTLDTAQGISTGFTITEGDFSSFTTY